MRVAYLVSQYPAPSHSFILKEIAGLRSKGFDVETISINRADSLSENDRKEEERTFYVKAVGFWRALWCAGRALLRHPLGSCKAVFTATTSTGFDLRRMLWQLFYLIEAAVIGCWLVDNKFTHLHVHFANPAANVALLVNRIFGIGYSMTVHGPDCFDNVKENLLSSKVSHACFVSCISQYTRSQLMRHADSSEWNKLEVVRLGVDTSALIPRPQSIQGRTRILMVGRLVPAKGPEILVQAVLNLLESGYKIQLDVVGDGPVRQRLQCLASGNININFLGKLPHDEVLKMVSSTDLFVLPSFAEGVPVALMEAMSCGVPCISCHVCGIPELIVDNETGLLIPPGDRKSLESAISKIIDNPELGKRLGVAGRERVKKCYSANENIAALADLFGRYL